jgi:hypothetical protein
VTVTTSRVTTNRPQRYNARADLDDPGSVDSLVQFGCGGAFRSAFRVTKLGSATARATA